MIWLFLQILRRVLVYTEHILIFQHILYKLYCIYNAERDFESLFFTFHFYDIVVIKQQVTSYTQKIFVSWCRL